MPVQPCGYAGGRQRCEQRKHLYNQSLYTVKVDLSSFFTLRVQAKASAEAFTLPRPSEAGALIGRSHTFYAQTRYAPVTSLEPPTVAHCYAAATQLRKERFCAARMLQNIVSGAAAVPLHCRGCLRVKSLQSLQGWGPHRSACCLISI